MYMCKTLRNVRFCIGVIIRYPLPTQAARSSLALSYNDVSKASYTLVYLGVIC